MLNKTVVFSLLLFLSMNLSFGQNILGEIDWNPTPWTRDDGRSAHQNLNSLLDHLVAETEKNENLWFLDLHFSSVKMLVEAYPPDTAKMNEMIAAYSNYDSEGSMEKYINGAKQLIIAYEFKPGIVSYVVANLPQGWDPRISYPLYVWGSEGALNVGYPQGIYNLYDEQISGGLLWRAPSSRFKDGYSIVPGGLGQGSYTGDCAADFIMGIDTFIANFRTDRSKYYMGGFSNGGRATWYISTDEGLIGKYKFAGLALFAPNVDAPFLTDAYSSRVADVPIWLGYGDGDVTYGNKAKNLNEHLLSVNHAPEVFREYKGVSHTWTQEIQGDMYYFLQGKQSILEGEIPLAPGNLHEVEAEERRLEISWDDYAENELFFSVQRKDLGQENFSEVSKVAPDIEYYIDTTVIPGNRYIYRVVAENESGASACSNELEVKTPGITIWNCAPGKMIRASNESYEGNSFNLIDGHTTNTDMYRWNATGYPQNVEIDLYTDFDISILKLYAYDNREYLYTIEAKTDGGEYSVITDRSVFNKSEPVYVDRVDVQARFIKLTVTGALIYSGNGINIAELEVFGRMSNQTDLIEVNIDSSLWLGVGDTYKLKVAYTPATATIKDVYWESADTSVARVDNKGNVSAISIGTTKIRLTSKDGIKTDECLVKISSSSFSDLHLADRVKVYPNPVKDGKLFVELPDYENAIVHLTDINGKILLSRIITEAHLQISTADLVPGLYLLQCKFGNHIVVQKLVIE